MLREYQSRLVDEFLTATAQRVLLQLPTGTGKTRLATEIVRQSPSSVFVVHRKELIEQTERAYKLAGIDYGVVQSGKKIPIGKKHYIAMIQTLIRRPEFLSAFRPELLIVDEFHLAVSPSYHALYGAWLKERVMVLNEVVTRPTTTRLLGLTATPWRLDRKGFDDVIDKLICSKDISWFIENEYLNPYEYYGAPRQVDISKVQIKQGDYNPQQIEELVSTAEIIGNVIGEYRKHLDGKQAIVFGATVEDSKRMAIAFNAAGISAEHLDGDSSDEHRRETLERYRKGELLVLCNYSLFAEGLDVPNVNGVILRRRTKSLVFILQAIGRGLRKSEGTTIILDHAGNYLEHGLPDDAREWSLGSRAKNVQAVTVKTCSKCFAVNYATSTKCKACDHVFPVAKRVVDKKKELEEIALERIQSLPLVKWSSRFWSEVDKACKAKSMKQLQAIATRVGFKPGFGYILYKKYVVQREPIPVSGTM